MTERFEILPTRWGVLGALTGGLALAGLLAFVPEWRSYPLLQVSLLVASVWVFASLYYPLWLVIDRQARSFTLAGLFGTRFAGALDEVRQVTLIPEVRGVGRNRKKVFPVVLVAGGYTFEVSADTDYLGARRLSERLAGPLGARILDSGMGETIVRSAGTLQRRWVQSVPASGEALPPAPVRLKVLRQGGKLAVRLPGQHPLYWSLAILLALGATALPVFLLGSDLTGVLAVAGGMGLVVLLAAAWVLAPPVVEAAPGRLAVRYPLGLRDHVDLDGLEEIRLDLEHGGLLLIGDAQLVRLWSPLEEYEVDWLKQAIARAVA
ncbi:MAG: hypothetical protein AMXMBFR33_50520 [Candidatus Xenobia bacterium]